MTYQGNQSGPSWRLRPLPASVIDMAAAGQPRICKCEGGGIRQTDEDGVATCHKCGKPWPR